MGFNDEWEVVTQLGEGNTAKVYLCQKVALKLFR